MSRSPKSSQDAAANAGTDTTTMRVKRTTHRDLSIIAAIRGGSLQDLSEEIFQEYIRRWQVMTNQRLPSAQAVDFSQQDSANAAD